MDKVRSFKVFTANEVNVKDDELHIGFMKH